MRLIDADALSEEIESLKVSVSGRPATWDEAKADILQVIDEQPTVDAADVMRGMWISVKDRLPGKYVDASGNLINFMVYMPKYGVDIANYLIQEKTWFCLGVPAKVTHWMTLPELPEPPEEDKL